MHRSRSKTACMAVAVNSLPFLSTSFAACNLLPFQSIAVHVALIWFVVESQIFFLTIFAAQSWIVSVMHSSLSHCVSVYHTLQPPPPTQRLKAAQEGRFLVSSSTLALTVDAKCCVRMHFPTEMCPLSCATNQLAYVTMQPSSPPQTHPLTTPRIINHYSIVFTGRRDDTASPTY